jgi:hypothetical protein
MDEFTKAMQRSGPAEMTSYERKRFDQQAGNCVDCGASLSRHSDGQPGNPSHGDGLPHHHVHPSQERAFNRAEAPFEVHHHEAEPHDPAATAREHRERLAHHAARRK